MGKRPLGCMTIPMRMVPSLIVIAYLGNGPIAWGQASAVVSLDAHETGMTTGI